MTVSEYKQEIDKIYTSCTKNDFVDYDRCSRLYHKIDKYIEKARLALRRENRFNDLFEVTLYAYEKWGVTNKDDSNGYTQNLESDIFKIWDDIYENGYKDITHRKMYEDLIAKTDGTLIDYVEDDLFKYIMRRFKDPQMQEKKLAYLYEKIDEAEAAEDEKEWNKYLVDMYKRMVLQIFSEQGADIKFIRNYAKNLTSIEARRLLAEIEHDYGNAEECLKIYCELAHEELMMPRLDYPINIRLKDLYKEYGCREEYADQIVALVCLDVGNKELWDEFKSWIPIDVWAETRDQLFDIFEVDNAMAFPLYASEGCLDRLMDGVEATKQKYYYLKKYAKYLEPMYPDRCLQVLIKAAESEAAEANDRRDYQHVARVLRWIKKYPNGASISHDLARKFCEAYPRKSALLEELEEFRT